MELQFLSFPILAFFLMVFIIAKNVKKFNAKISTPKLPPGPWKLPLIGNIHQLLIGSTPHHSLKDLALKHGPLMHLQLGQVSTIVVSTPEIAKQILKTNDVIFAQRPSSFVSGFVSYDSTDIVFSPYGDYWRRLRKICVMELLSAKRVQSFRSIREAEVSDLIRTLSLNAGAPVNLSKKIFSSTYGITSRAAFGKKSKDQEAFISVVTQILELSGGFCVADLYPSFKVVALISGMKTKLEKLHQEADRILENIINEHKDSLATTESGKGEGEENLVDVLLKIQETLEFPLTGNNIKAVILDIFTAGSDTSSITVDWAMSEMLKNPGVMKKAQVEVRQVFDGKGRVDEMGLHELKYLKLVIKETLRLHPSAPLIWRECRENCEIDGYEIPVKTKVLVNAWAIGRDPGYWSDPERFYPERFLDNPIDYRGTYFEYIPFGAGRRICPGISFALPNIELPLAQLLYHFDWKLPGMKKEDLDMSEVFGLTVRRKHDLYLIPIPYHPLPSE